MVVAALMVAITAGVVRGSPVTLPAGLNPGDQYRLAFLTTNTHNAVSSNISDYDAFVTSEANSNAALLALGTTWVAIGSTSTVNAFDHIGGSFSIPVYNLAGSLVATGSSDLWNGSIGAPIEYDQNGSAKLTVAWTGTLSNGSKSSNPLGAGVPTYGRSSGTNASWVFDGQIGQTTAFELYGISGTLTVPVVPEPGTLAILGFTLAGLTASRWRVRTAAR